MALSSAQKMTSDEVNTLFSKKQKIYIKNNLSAIKSNTVIFFKTNDKTLYYSTNSWVAKWYGYNSVELSNVTTVDENGTVGTQSLHRSGVDLDSNYKVIKTSKLYEENGYVNTQPFNNSNILDQLANFVTTYYGIVKGKEITYKLPENVRQNYREVRYIEGTGSQYIDTEQGASYAPWDIEIVWQNTVSSEISIFGHGNNNPNFQIKVGAKRLLIYYNNGTTDGKYEESYSFNTTDINTLKVSDTKCILNGNTYSKKSNTGNVSNGFFNFFRIRETYYKYRLFYAKISLNGVTKREFIPCVRKSDNAAGLYDLANDVFYENYGSGSFLVGELQSESEVTDVKMGDLQIQTVMLGEKEIWTKPRIYLFKDGAWTGALEITGMTYVSATGGDYGSGLRGDEGYYTDSEKFWIRATSQSNSYARQVIYRTNAQIDWSKYKTIHLKTFQRSYQTRTNARCYINNGNKTISSTNSTSAQEYTVDISNINVTDYLWFRNETPNYTGGNAYFYDIWVE